MTVLCIGCLAHRAVRFAALANPGTKGNGRCCYDPAQQDGLARCPRRVAANKAAAFLSQVQGNHRRIASLIDDGGAPAVSLIGPAPDFRGQSLGFRIADGHDPT